MKDIQKLTNYVTITLSNMFSLSIQKVHTQIVCFTLDLQVDPSTKFKNFWDEMIFILQYYYRTVQYISTSM